MSQQGGVGRVYALSDLHADFPQNQEWLAGSALHAPGGHRDDALVVAGDVSDDLQRLDETLRLLAHTFGHVFFVPGNHELWLRCAGANPAYTSLDKFHDVLSVCAAAGVHTEPQRVCGVDIVPLFSWYDVPPSQHTLFFPDDKMNNTEEIWTDTHLCKWPATLAKHERAAYFVALNQERCSRQYEGPVVSFSHFFPSIAVREAHRHTVIERWERMKLLQPAIAASNLKPPNFTLVAGTSLLEANIRGLRSTVHVIGHSHRNLDVMLTGVRYVNRPLGYPSEREKGFVDPVTLVPLL
eukprot:TRINITY_DN8520_c0_g1_i1.p1 TRINITY_DN8520_c0_g1~~TRINITY_DN8520_c0_g1_i1.p1  ORF type:complete len:296 (-),score=63.77 TRINITY_DN8520_c0_g1_i1:115-1002(-)